MKRDTILSLGGGLALTALGYLVWRHEMTVQAAQQAQQQAANQAQSDATIQALQQQLATMQASSAYTGYGQSYGQTYSDYSQVSGTTLASVPQDTTLSQILSAFLGQQSSQVGTAGTTAAQASASPTGTAGSNTSAAVTPTTITQVAQIPDSVLNAGVVSGVTGINQQQASNPIVTSQVGAASGASLPAVSASHTLQAVTGAT